MPMLPPAPVELQSNVDATTIMLLSQRRYDMNEALLMHSLNTKTIESNA